MGNTELLILRIAVFLPLIAITFQVILLRRILNSRAWTMLVVGFTMFVLVRGVTFLVTTPVWSQLIGTFAGYAFVMVGFQMLRRDLLRLRGTLTGRRKTDPKPLDPKTGVK